MKDSYFADRGITESNLRKVGAAVLADLEDRRAVKQPLQALKYGDSRDKEIYIEIQVAIGKLAWKAIDDLKASRLP